MEKQIDEIDDLNREQMKLVLDFVGLDKFNKNNLLLLKELIDEEIKRRNDQNGKR